MSLVVTLERSMWANLAVKTSSAVKDDLLDLPMDHRGLLIGGLNMLVEAHASDQRHRGATNALPPLPNNLEAGPDPQSRLDSRGKTIPRLTGPLGLSPYSLPLPSAYSFPELKWLACCRPR